MSQSEDSASDSNVEKKTSPSTLSSASSSKSSRSRKSQKSTGKRRSEVVEQRSDSSDSSQVIIERRKGLSSRMAIPDTPDKRPSLCSDQSDFQKTPASSRKQSSQAKFEIGVTPDAEKVTSNAKAPVEVTPSKRNLRSAAEESQSGLPKDVLEEKKSTPVSIKKDVLPQKAESKPPKQP